MKTSLGWVWLLPAVYLLGTPATFSLDQGPPLHRDLGVAVRLVDEAWHILDFAAPEVWPAWTSYRDEAYFTAIPKLQDIIINPPADPGPGYLRLEQVVQGKAIYLRAPSPIEKVWGGAYRFRLGGKTVKAAQFYPPSAQIAERWMKYLERLFSPAPPPPSGARIGNSLERLVTIIIHEAFHRWQESALDRAKIVNRTHPSPFDGDDGQAALSRLEGRVLFRAASVKDRERLIELSREFLAVRQERRRALVAEDIAWEKRNEFVEGSAMYVETAILQVLAERGYRPRVLQPADPNFHGFAIASDMVQLSLLAIEQSPRLRANEEEAHTRTYYLGMAQGLILDRLVGPMWKRALLEPDAYFENLLQKASGFDPRNAAAYLERARLEFR